MFKQEEIMVYIKKWQDILRLRDWDLTLKLVEQEWRKTGDVKIDREDKKAVVMINNHNPYNQNIEEVVIHELLHIKLWNMDQLIEGLIYDVFGHDETDPKFKFAYGQFMSVLESTVEDLTKGYLETGGDEREVCYGRVLKQVKKELGKNKI